jgi:hypothetical protein
MDFSDRAGRTARGGRIRRMYPPRNLLSCGVAQVLGPVQKEEV